MGDNRVKSRNSATFGDVPLNTPSCGPIAQSAREIDAKGCYRLPISCAQHQLWLSWQVNLDIPCSSSTYAIHFRGPLDTRVLERALNEICKRHEVLRSCFVCSDGQLVQVIRRHEAQPLEIVSFEHLAEPEQEANLKAFAEQQTHCVFDLGEGPLVRLVLARCSADDHCLILTFHRAIFDRPSFAVLRKDLSSLYDAYVKGETPAIPKLTIQYADYAAHQLTYLESPAYQRDLHCWTSQLAKTEFTLRRLADRPQPPPSLPIEVRLNPLWWASRFRRNF